MHGTETGNLKVSHPLYTSFDRDYVHIVAVDVELPQNYYNDVERFSLPQANHQLLHLECREFGGEKGISLVFLISEKSTNAFGCSHTLYSFDLLQLIYL